MAGLTWRRPPINKLQSAYEPYFFDGSSNSKSLFLFYYIYIYLFLNACANCSINISGFRMTLIISVADGPWRKSFLIGLFQDKLGHLIMQSKRFAFRVGKSLGYWSKGCEVKKNLHTATDFKSMCKILTIISSVVSRFSCTLDWIKAAAKLARE